MKFAAAPLAALSLLVVGSVAQDPNPADILPSVETLETYDRIQEIHHFEGTIKEDIVLFDQPFRHLRERGLEAGGLEYNYPWIDMGKVTKAAGRLLYVEDGKGKQCSATVICDFTDGRSLIATAAHCVLNDNGEVNKDFFFIPMQDNQDEEGQDPEEVSDHSCDNDPYGCWTVDHVVVDESFATGQWPYVIPVDYAVLVVRDSTDTHISCDPQEDCAIDSGECNPCKNPDGDPDRQPILDKAVEGMGFDCSNSQRVHGLDDEEDKTRLWMLGYTSAEDPYFRYCEDEVHDWVYPMSRDGKNGGPYWFVENCRLSRGSSGGPVLPQTDDDSVAGSNKMVSIISFERKNRQGTILGHGGPHLHDNSFCCLVQAAQNSTFGTDVFFTWTGENCSPKQGGGFGDPHFQTWSGEYFDYQGACDLVLADSPLFGDGLGFAAHVRTKARFDYSFIEYAAIKIGDDILEVGGYGSYMYNGVHMGDIGLMGGKYNVTRTVTNRDAIFVIRIKDTDQITVKAHKDLVSVGFSDADEHHFKDAVGMMGEYHTGARLSRSGDVVIEDENAFAQEWQVRPGVDPDIFHSKSNIQYPAQKCTVPAPMKQGRRLGESISIDDATKACAQFLKKEAHEACIYDVIATGDLEAAQSGAF